MYIVLAGSLAITEVDVGPHSAYPALTIFIKILLAQLRPPNAQVERCM